MGLCDRLAQHLEVSGNSLPDEPADVVVAVGFALSRNRLGCSPATAEIARVAYRLWRLGLAKDLLLQGKGHRGWPVSEAGVMLRLLGLECDVDLADQRIFREEESCNTRENAVEAGKLAKRYGWQRIVVVAHWQHVRRVLRTFRRALGPDCDVYIIGVVSPPSSDSSKWFTRHPLLFSAWDTLALAYFRLRRWA